MQAIKNEEEFEEDMFSEKISSRADAWMRNKFNMIQMRMDHVREISQESRQSYKGFLWDLEHHFVAGDNEAELSEPFQFVQRYLSDYPAVTSTQSVEALRMLAWIKMRFRIVDTH